jgi:hypothetical protein
MHLVYGSSIHSVICSIAALEPASSLAHGDSRILGPITLDELFEGLDVLGVFYVR